MKSLKPQIRFCTAKDGTRVAVSKIGSGPPIVRAAHWLSHVEFDLDSPVWRPWLAELSRRNTYITYDQRGCGLSDRDVDDFDLDNLVGDLEAVVDQVGIDRFALLGMSQGGAIGTAFASQHPDRVSHLVLLNAYGRGTLCRYPTDDIRSEAETLVNLIRLGWGKDNPAFRQAFTTLFIPGGKAEQHSWWNDIQRQAATPETAARILEALHTLDVTELAKNVRVPTLVMHSRGDARVPFEEGRWLASHIPSAQFVAFDSDNHVLLESESAWAEFLATLRNFIRADGADSVSTSDVFKVLTPSERDVLALIAKGFANSDIAERLSKSEKTVRNQISSIFCKLNVKSRAEAIVLAREGRDSESA